MRVEIVSTERIDVLPAHSRYVPVEFSEDVEYAEIREVRFDHPYQMRLSQQDGNVVVFVHNDTRQTFSIFPGTRLATVVVPDVETMYTQEIEEAFSETEDGKFRCPLCDKEYASESWLTRHLRDKHNTTI